MRVLVDARSAAFPQRTGVGTYTWELLRRLPAVDPGTTYLAWYLDARSPRRKPFTGTRVPNLRTVRTPIPGRLFALTARHGLPRVEWLARFDVLLAPNFLPPPTRAPRTVVTVHDLGFRRMPETAPASTRRWLAEFESCLARASRIIAVSESTKADLVELCGVRAERVTVIPLGVDLEAYRPAAGPAVRSVAARHGISGPYILFLGGIEPRKNLPRLVEAFSGLPEDNMPLLVIAGSGVRWNPEGRADLQAAMARLSPGLRARVRLVGYVPERDKAALLAGARALVYPSLYEGFGLPVLEAMACGTPVLTSGVSSLPEVAGEAAVIVDPTDVRAIRRGIERVSSDERLRSSLREAGLRRVTRFSWNETARRTSAVLQEVGAGEVLSRDG